MASTETCLPDPALLIKLVGVDIGSTIGMGYLGLSLSLVLYGVTCSQALNYYRSRKSQSDAIFTKLVVASVLILDTIHQGLILHVGYYYFVISYANPATLLTIAWSLPLEMILNLVIGGIVQIFLLHRVWKISNNTWLVAFLALVVTAAVGIPMVFPIDLFINPATELILTRLQPWLVVGSCVLLVVDALMAVVMAYYLYKSRTGFKRSDDMIRRLIALTVTTGSLTACFALGGLVSYLTRPFTFLDLFFNFQMGKLFTNALLTILNTRNFVRGPVVKTDDINSFHLKKLGVQPSQSQGSSQSGMRIVVSRTVESDRVSELKPSAELSV